MKSIAHARASGVYCACLSFMLLAVICDHGSQKGMNFKTFVGNKILKFKEYNIIEASKKRHGHG